MSYPPGECPYLGYSHPHREDALDSMLAYTCQIHYDLPTGRWLACDSRSLWVRTKTYEVSRERAIEMMQERTDEAPRRHLVRYARELRTKLASQRERVRLWADEAFREKSIKENPLDRESVQHSQKVYEQSLRGAKEHLEYLLLIAEATGWLEMLNEPCYSGAHC